jgi:hypothetical protein
MWEGEAGISGEVISAFLCSFVFWIVKLLSIDVFPVRLRPLTWMYAQSLIERLWKESSRCVLG